MNISVMPKDGESKIPISVAGAVLVDIQDLLTHIGEYLVFRELKLQNRIDFRLSRMFELFIDPASGVSMGASPSISTSGIMDDALALMERTLIGIGSGAGGYWIDDTFADPRFRRIIVKDVIRLSRDLRMNGEYYLRFSADSMFDNADVNKLEDYLGKAPMHHDDATCGVIRHVTSRSGRSDGLRLDVGDERLKISFLTPEIEDEAEGLADRAVIVAGRIRYSGERMMDVIDIGKVVPLETVRFRRMISSEGDISLTSPVSISVMFDVQRNEWNMRNDDLGMNISKDTWDDAMTAFHDYFIFLYNTYSSKDDTELSEEELDVKIVLNGLVSDTSE